MKSSDSKLKLTQKRHRRKYDKKSTHLDPFLPVTKACRHGDIIYGQSLQTFFLFSQNGLPLAEIMTSFKGSP